MEKFYKIVLPKNVLEIFHKSSYIHVVYYDGIYYPRSIFIRHNEVIDDNQRKIILRENSELDAYIIEFSPEDEHLSKEKILSILTDNTDVIFKIKSPGNKDRYLIKLTTLIDEFIQVGIIDLSFETIFCFIDEQNLIGCEQDITELGTLLYNHYKISEIEIINLAYNANSTSDCKINFYKILEPVSKYVYKNKNFLTIPGNSGGGNLSTYLSEEEAIRRSHDQLIRVNVQNSFRLKRN